jgi:polyisoprenoid-binding protein YceI
MFRTSVLALLALFAATAEAQVAPSDATMRLAVSADSRLWLEGTSNLHAWSCKASSIDAAIDVDADYTAMSPNSALKALRRVSVRVPVESLKCGHDKMDQNMYKALKADGTTPIKYILGSFDVLPGPNKDSITVHTVGTLTVAGLERPLQMDVIVTSMPSGAVRAQATVAILMTDFGIDPPRALLGTIRTGNRVLVKFDLNAGPTTAVANAGGQ